MSRINKALGALAFVSLLLPVSAWAAGGYIHEAWGSVYAGVDKSPLRRVWVNEPIKPGTVIRTGEESHAVLKFEDGQVISMQENSTLLVRSYVYDPRQAANNSIVLSMYKGGMRFITGQIGRLDHAAFRLATPNATIGVLGTDFMVAMKGSTAHAEVLQGSITVTNASGMTVLNAGQTAAVASTTSPVTLASAPAGTFNGIASIQVPAAVPGPIPAPVAVAAPTPAPAPLPPAAPVAPVAPVVAQTAAGGAAEGGAAAGAGVATAKAGMSATGIGIGIGLAAVVAAAARSTNSTTQH